MDTLKIIIEDVRKKVRKKKWICMAPSCNAISIKSHVLQKNGILNQISKGRHLVQPFVPSAFRYDGKNIIEIGKTGLNKAFTFPGFCNIHDTKIFKMIESESIDFHSKKVQLLFSYRALCQEIWRKHRFLEINKLLKVKVNPIVHKYLETAEFGNKSGVRNLTFFKKEIEKELFSRKAENFEFHIIKIPRIDICISIPLNIGHEELIKENLTRFGDNIKKWTYVNTSFLNIFPYQHKSVIIAGYHRDYPCNWIEELIGKLNSDNFLNVQKTISDLMTIRLDYWCMSPYLWEKLTPKNQNEIKSLYTNNYYNTNSKIETKFNLFKDIKTAYSN